MTRKNSRKIRKSSKKTVKNSCKYVKNSKKSKKSKNSKKGGGDLLYKKCVNNCINETTAIKGSNCLSKCIISKSTNNSPKIPGRFYPDKSHQYAK